MTERYLLLGGDVSRSPTPRMMNAAFKQLGLDATYSASNVAKGELGSAFARIFEAQTSGFSVTMPHKTAIVRFLTLLDDASSRIGAVNTVKRHGESYLGYNTDVNGIVESLESRGHSRPKRAFVIGTGGVARAFCEAMHELDCGELVALSRSPGKASDFLEAMRAAFPRIELDVVPAENPPSEAPDLVFNASPAGASVIDLSGHTKRILESRPTVFDAVYLPVKTELIAMAEKLGCETIYGHEMRLAQAANALKIWTGHDAPLETMKKSLLDSLGVRRD